MSTSISVKDEAVDLLINYIKNNSENYFIEASSHKKRGVFLFGYRNLSELIHNTRHVPIFAALNDLQSEENMNSCRVIVDSYDINNQFVVDIAIMDESIITTTINRNDNIITPNNSNTLVHKVEYEKMTSQYIDLLSNTSKCDQCHKFVKNIPKCAKCKTALYCSVQCQKLDWPNHKNICSKIKE